MLGKGLEITMRCEYCDKYVRKLDAHVDDENYLKLRMGEPAIVFCSNECMENMEESLN
jgi:hypothetical protein